MSQLPLLSLLVWLPILGGAALLAMGRLPANTARWTALAISLLALLAAEALARRVRHEAPR